MSETQRPLLGAVVLAVLLGASGFGLPGTLAGSAGPTSPSTSSNAREPAAGPSPSTPAQGPGAGATYTVNLTETGLPVFTYWGLTVWPSSSPSSTQLYSNPAPDGINLTLANGTYDYNISDIPGYHESTLPYVGGAFTVAGTVLVLPTLSFSPTVFTAVLEETGLPTSVGSWAVLWNGSLYTSAVGATISVGQLANGSYPYTVAPVAGYTTSSFSGRFVVAGPPRVPALVIPFVAATYSVTFSESGLTSGTFWGVQLTLAPGNQPLMAAIAGPNGSSIVFGSPGLANGTYAFSVPAIAGFVANPSSGAITVSGRSVVVPIDWSLFSYPVTFTETGLPAGTTWQVTVNGSTQSTSAGSALFEEPNGTFAYTVGPVPGYTATPSSGYLGVNGAGLTLAVSFAKNPAAAYAVSFLESGLPSGTAWSATINGSTTSSSGSSLTFSLPNGTYRYSIVPGVGYAATPSSGTVTVAGGPVSVSIVFTSTIAVQYSVTFTESGASLTSSGWTVVLNGTGRTGYGAVLSFSVPNGSYAFSVAALSGYVVYPSAGTVTVQGASVSVAVTFTFQGYTVTFSETGLPSGASWAVTLSGSGTLRSTSPLVSFRGVGTGAYIYNITPIAGYLTTWAASLYVSVNTTVSLHFSTATYGVSFVESGLGGGTAWSLTFAGVTTGTVSTALAFQEPNGTYAFAISPVSGFSATPGSGSVVVTGASLTIAITFSPIAYRIAFTESGLPGGTRWAVSLAGTLTASGGPTIAFPVANGTYPYSIASVPSYSSSPSSGVVTVAGVNVSVAIAFSATAQPTYAVTFSETGLPLGTAWSVAVIGGATNSTPAPGTNLFVLGNGSYTYTIGSLPSYTSSPSRGTVTVAGTGASVGIVFTARPTFELNLSFTETGLPNGTTWSVTAGPIDGNSSTATGTARVLNVTWQLTNATFSSTITYRVGLVPGYTAVPESANLSLVCALPCSSSPIIQFVPTLYSVSFLESGLPGGTSWAATFAGNTTRGAGASLTFVAPNGTYAWNLSSVAGWQPGSARGTLSVNGSSVAVTVLFRATVAPAYSVTFLETGLPAKTTWSVALGGTTASSSSTSVLFTATNGTYAFTVLAVAGFALSEYAGSVTVAGSAVAVTLAWSPFSYAVTFSPSGLPPGARFCVTLNGTTACGVGGPVEFEVPNGTYAFNVSGIGGYQAARSSGVVTVAGSSLTVGIAWIRVFSVTFLSNGLAPGTPWSVDFAGILEGTNAASLVITVANGTYSFSIPAPEGYTVTPSSGAVTIAGADAGVALTFEPIYTVTFEETGLPAGEYWGVRLANVTVLTTTSTAVFEEAAGSYVYALVPVSGWRASGYTGSVGVSANVTVSLRWTRTVYALQFSESGLPNGTVWSAVVNGTLYANAAPAAISLSLPNGTYAYDLTDLNGYLATGPPVSGTITVDGLAVTLPSIAFVRLVYSLTVSFAEQGLPSGTSWGVLLSTSANRTTARDLNVTLLFANGTLPANLPFEVELLSGFAPTPGSGLLASSTLSLDRSSPTVINISFAQVLYAVVFTESGLPTGTNWSVDLGGNLGASTTSDLSFREPNGSYAFDVLGVAGWRASAYEGTVTVADAGLAVVLSWTPSLYRVTFTEQGLENGSPWSMTWDGNSSTALAPSALSFLVPNGSYLFRTGSVPGYTASPAAGSGIVSGEPIAASIVYTAAFRGTYAVTFEESGLATGQPWNVTLNGTTVSSLLASIAFLVRNGSYVFSVGAVAGYSNALASGRLDVEGAGASRLIAFNRLPPNDYALTFEEQGLPLGMNWSVDDSGRVQSTLGANLTVWLANGSYVFDVAVGNGSWQTTEQAVDVVIAGAGVSVPIPFEPAYPATFTEVGMTPGTEWYVNLSGTLSTREDGGLAARAGALAVLYSFGGTTASLTFSLPNGTYLYTVASAEPSWTAAVPNGTLAVDGHSPPPVTARPARVQGSFGWVAPLVVVGVGVVAVLLVVLTYRSRSHRPPPVAGRPITHRELYRAYQMTPERGLGAPSSGEGPADDIV